jgi:hypothetical protein
MNGPMPFRREVAPLDDMLASVGGEGWEGLDKLFHPAEVPDRFDPGAEVKKFLAAAMRTPAGREAIQWLADITLRAPYPHVGTSLEAAAIAAAKHEARAAVGEVLLRAIAQGDQLLNQRSQNHE